MIRILLATFLLLAGCESGLESDGEEVNAEPYYKFAIGSTMEDSDTQVFEGVKTEWNLSSGIAVLGPEDEGEPLGRLELVIGATNDDSKVAIDVATLSTTDVRVGTGEELNAKLYALSGTFECPVTSINSAHITIPQICFIEMDRVIVNQNDVAEHIIVGIGFTAVD